MKLEACKPSSVNGSNYLSTNIQAYKQTLQWEDKSLRPYGATKNQNSLWVMEFLSHFALFPAKRDGFRV